MLQTHPDDATRPTPLRRLGRAWSRILEMAFLGLGSWAMVSALTLESIRGYRDILHASGRTYAGQRPSDFADYDFLLTVSMVCLAVFLACRWMRLRYPAST